MKLLAFAIGWLAGATMILGLLLAGDFEQQHPMGGRR